MHLTGLAAEIISRDRLKRLLMRHLPGHMQQQLSITITRAARTIDRAEPQVLGSSFPTSQWKARCDRFPRERYNSVASPCAFRSGPVRDSFVHAKYVGDRR
jgi:hypothetical protein